MIDKNWKLKGKCTDEYKEKLKSVRMILQKLKDDTLNVVESISNERQISELVQVYILTLQIYMDSLLLTAMASSLHSYSASFLLEI